VKQRTLAIMCYSAIIIAIITAVLIPRTASAQSAPVITAVRTAEPISLDGSLSEKAWQTATPVDSFTQRELVEGAEPSERTQVRILYDDINLYIGVVCHDGNPAGIVNTQMRYDSDLQQDDSFTVALDTFNDRRSGYVFATNPSGARQDALISSLEHMNEDWNGIWDAAARITDNGWTAEMVIPFLTLRFPDAFSQEWGVNFRRIIRGRNEEVLWTAWGRDDGILQIAKAGRLVGLTNIRRGKSAEIKPYLLGGLEHERAEGKDNTFKAGLDIKYPLTGDLTLDFTTRTDFAQVESDKEKMNLTRFSMQYPEKRQFFLEGAEIFDNTRTGSSSNPNTKLFYSRRIGLTPDPDREIVPILGGAKLSGKSGPWSIGLMTMQTEKTTVWAENDTSMVKNTHPASNYSVLRLKRDVLDQSYFGVIATSVHRMKTPELSPSGEDSDRFLNKDDNFLAGFDFSYKTSRLWGNKNFTVAGYMAGTKTPDFSGGNLASLLKIDFPNDIVDANASYESIGRNFNPELGFVERAGIQKYTSKFRYTPRVDLPHIKKLMFAPYQIEYVTDMGSAILERTYELRPFGMEFVNGDQMTFNAHFHYDYVEDAYDVFDDIVMPAGHYEYWHRMVDYQTENTGRLSLEARAIGGEYYSGNRDAYSAALTYKFNRYFSIVPDISYTDITLDTGSFIARQATTRFEVNLSPRLTSSTFVQWDNESDEANLNFRIHYIPKIGSDVYIVYNHLWEEENRLDRDDRFLTVRNTGMVKVDYLFRF